MTDTSSTTAPPKRMSRAGALAAATAGGVAQRAGTPVTGCPHPVTGDVTDRYNAHYWIKGWAAASTNE